MNIPKHILPIFADEAHIEQRKTNKYRSFLYIIIGMMILSSIIGLKLLFPDTVSQRQLQGYEADIQEFLDKSMNFKDIVDALHDKYEERDEHQIRKDVAAQKKANQAARKTAKQQRDAARAQRDAAKAQIASKFAKPEYDYKQETGGKDIDSWLESRGATKHALPPPGSAGEMKWILGARAETESDKSHDRVADHKKQRQMRRKYFDRWKEVAVQK